MIKSTEKKAKIILIVLSILVFFSLVFLLSLPSSCKYPLNFDTHKTFGDCRFEIGRYINKLGLEDNKHFYKGNQVASTIIFKIDRYLEIPPYVYINGYYLAFDDEPDEGLNHANDINSENIIEFKNPSDVPYYTKLNYETGEAKFYSSVDEIPKGEQIYFEGDLNFWCEFWKTCYQGEET